MAARRTGTRKPPPRAETLIPEYEGAVAALHPAGRLIIGGKSMGGRVASMVADGLFAKGAVRGLLCLGYPFHPPGKPEQLRTAHLAALAGPEGKVRHAGEGQCGRLLGAIERRRDLRDRHAFEPADAFHAGRIADADRAGEARVAVVGDGDLERAGLARAAFPVARLAPWGYPAAYEEVIAVTATDAADRLMSQANRGPYVFVAAPGVDMIAPVDGGTDLVTGTSFAAAIVSGAIANLDNVRPGVSAEWIEANLAATAGDLGKAGRDNEFGYGLLDYRRLADAQ